MRRKILKIETHSHKSPAYVGRDYKYEETNIGLPQDFSSRSTDELLLYKRNNWDSLQSKLNEIEQRYGSGNHINDNDTILRRIRDCYSNIIEINEVLSRRTGVVHPLEPMQELIDKAKQRGKKAYQEQLEKTRRSERNRLLAIITIAIIIITSIYFLSRGCDESPTLPKSALRWTFQKSDIPFGEYGGRVKQFEDSKTAYIRKGPGSDFSNIGFVPSGFWVRIKNLDDKELGEIKTNKENRKGWWLKVYSKDDKAGYIVDEYLEKRFKKE